MNLIKKILSILFCVYLLYKVKLDCIRFFSFVYRRYIREDLIEITGLNKTLLIDIYYSLCILMCVIFFYTLSKIYSIDKFILLCVVISPILYDVSDIIYDKSCLKPWRRWDVFLWYFPIRLVIWSLLYLMFRKMFSLLKEKVNLIMISCVLVLYVVVKIYSKYNF